MNKKGLILTISAPSGVGKDSVCSALLNMDNGISFIVSATTRDKRDGEEHGVDYHFLTKDEFMGHVEDEKFLEWLESEHNGHYYGMLRHIIEEKIDEGNDVINDLTWDGVETMRKEWPQQVVRFLLMPPSTEEWEKRLRLRTKISHEDPKNTQQRIDNCIEDIKNWQKDGYKFTSPDLVGSALKDYDYVIINKTLDDTVNQFHKIIKQERAKRG